jgi:hypothetical protein
MKSTNLGSTAIMLLLVAGCGGTVMSPSKLASSEGSVRGAEEVGASEEPQAGLQLKLAQEQLAEAKALSQQGHGEKADRKLARAEVDADLAIALTNEASAQRVAEVVSADVRKAKEDSQ